MGLHDKLFEDNLIHLADVERATQALDGVGGRTDTYASHLTDVACRIQPLPIRQREIARLRMYCLPSVDIQEDDHVQNTRRTSTGATIFEGNVYRVRFVGDPAGAGHHQIVDLVELSGSS